MVIAQCVKAAKLLEAEGISTYVDESSHSTPGQKMRHWYSPQPLSHDTLLVHPINVSRDFARSLSC